VVRCRNLCSFDPGVVAYALDEMVKCARLPVTRRDLAAHLEANAPQLLYLLAVVGNTKVREKGCLRRILGSFEAGWSWFAKVRRPPLKGLGKPPPRKRDPR
jgi:hypothetical protein